MRISGTQKLATIILLAGTLTLHLSGCKKEYTCVVKGIVRWEMSGFRASHVYAQVCDTGDPIWDKITITSEENGTTVSFNPDAPVGGVKAVDGPTSALGRYAILVWRVEFSGEPILRATMDVDGRFWVLSPNYEARGDIQNDVNKDMFALTPNQIIDIKHLQTKEGIPHLIHAVPAPETWLKADSGDTVELVGALQGELSRLQGTKVKVWGRLTDKGDFDVQYYSIQDLLCSITREIPTGKITIFYRPLKGQLLVRNANWIVYSDKPSEMIGGDYYLTDGREEVQILNPNNQMKGRIKYPGIGPNMFLCGEEVYSGNKITIDHATRFGFLE